MKRFNVILRNNAGYKPRDRGRIIRLVRGIVAAPVDVRVHPGFVEVVVFGELGRGELERLGEAFGGVLEVVEGEPAPVGAGAVETVRRYLESGYYWRVHVAAEEAWRRGGGPEAQALSLAAGALAKAQEGLLDAARRILGKARRLGGEGVDYECLERALEAVAEGSRVDASTCIDGEWLRRILAPLAYAGDRGAGT